MSGQKYIKSPLIKEENFMKNSVVYYANSNCDCFYYVISGRIDLIINDEHRIYYKTFKSREIFAAEEFFLKDNYKYTAIAVEKTKLIKIDSRNINYFCMKYPKSILRLMARFTSQLKKSNEILCYKNSKEKSFVDCDKVVADGLIVNRLYNSRIDLAHVEYLYETTYDCHVCSKKFKLNQVKTSRLSVINKEEDLRIIHKDIDLMWYRVVICPKCGYADFSNNFGKSRSLKTELRNEEKIDVLSKLKNNTNPKSIKVNMNEVLEDYFYLIKLTKYFNFKSIEIANMWQNLVWCFNDLEDCQNSKNAKFKLLEYLKDFLMNQFDDISSNEEKLILYRVALIHFEQKQYKEAIDYLHLSKKIETNNKQLQNMIGDKLISINTFLRSLKKEIN